MAGRSERCDLLRVIGETVYGIDPQIKLGLMTGERYFEGYQFARYADALSQGGTHEIMWRPGGGAYDDFYIRGTLEKMQEIGRQNAYLPDYVSVIQSEIENFPYNLIKKMARSTAFEAAMSMTVGCTGAAFNIVPSETLESLDSVVPHLRFIDRMIGFYQILQEKLDGLKPAGIHTGWRPFSLATSANGILGWKGYSPNHRREMFYFGLPEAYHPGFAPVTMLSGQDAAVMKDEEIKKLLSGGVYCAGEFEEGVRFAAYSAVYHRGGRLTGGKKSYGMDGEEVLPKKVGLRYVFDRNQGVPAVRGASLCMDACDEVWVVTALSVDTLDADPQAACKNAARKAIRSFDDFEALQEAHEKIFSSFFDRTRLYLPENKTLQDMFDMARYVAISSGMSAASSSNGHTPINLQGIWNRDTRPAWESDYHLDLNIQMCYWPLPAMGLADLMEPYLSCLGFYPGRKSVRRISMGQKAHALPAAAIPGC